MKSKRERAVRGQATLEAALLMPIAFILVVTVIDVGRAILLMANLQSAADSVARSLEASMVLDATPERAVRAACSAYPNLAGKVEAEVVRSAHEVEPVDYRLYDSASGVYRVRASHVARDRYSVTLAFTGGWTSPVMVAVSQGSGGGGHFVLKANSIATVDKTLGEW